MTCPNRIVLVMTLLVVPAFLNAQTPSAEEGGWSFSQRFQGSSNNAGVVLKSSSTAIYAFNPHVKAYAGVPFYFARAAALSGATEFMNGIGNVYTGFLVTADNEAIQLGTNFSH